ncbi:fructose-bisphosphate aldolase-lysine N-methyltransferase, chloroplastic [Populus alba]|uniref:fructose-bisphosphate aldolase-lysine N-methyltransferase, chloroplastic n=1 Tax=Populus alba TaxID=43335 RepID=UPI003CC74D67
MLACVFFSKYPQMLSRSRFINPRRSLLQLFTTAHRFSKKLNISSSPVPEVLLNHLDEECVDFLPWLERKAGVEISSKLYVGKSAYGRSLFASKSIQTGECILRVPYNVQIAPDNLLPKVASLLDNEVGNVAKLAIVILIEQKRGQESEWAPYISCLPRPGEMHSTIFWSKSELDMIHQSTVYQETIKEKYQIEKDFLKIKLVGRTQFQGAKHKGMLIERERIMVSSIATLVCVKTLGSRAHIDLFGRALDHSPEILDGITLEDFIHAYALVRSRAWGSTRGVSLIPFADFSNHDGVSEAFILNDEDKQVSEVIADRNFAPHEEVLIRYGKFSNAALLLEFGFIVPHNIHDQVQIHIDVPNHDFLGEMKLDILRRHHLPTTRYANDFKFSGDSFIIKSVLWVGIVIVLGKGLPQSLRAFARVLCCNSSQDLIDLAMEAAQNDGRLARCPLKNSSREIQAHEILLSRISQLIEEYNVSMKSLEPVAASVCERFALRRQMALDLLTGELRVLESAYTWLKNYCATLLQHSTTNDDASACGNIRE